MNTPHRRAVLSFVAVLVISSLSTLAGCAASPAPEEAVFETEDELRTTYGDLLSTLEGPDLDRWVTVRSKLGSGFDRICGDTICSGDYANLTTVRIACSSTAIARRLRACTWVLGGSVDHVDGSSGALVSEPRVFTCAIPVGGSARAMLDALEAAGDDALMTPLPATGKSFYDGLVECFATVVGPPPVTRTDESWVELGDLAWSGGPDGGAAWQATLDRLRDGFDDVCGDTFCEGEYPDIAPLRFFCAVEAKSERVSVCRWSFAAAELALGSRGRWTTRAETRRCDVTVDASMADLLTALSADDPLRAKLPGRETTIYDALVHCL